MNGINTHDSRDRVDGYNEDRGINDQGHLGSLSHSKPDEGKGYERDRRNETKELDVRVDHRPDKADVSHQETQRDAQPTTDGPSGQDPEEADLDVPPQRPVFYHIDENPGDEPWGRKEKGRCAGGQSKPGQEEKKKGEGVDKIDIFVE